MTNKHEVISAHQQNPTWGATDIARHLGCLPEYVRATASRQGIVLPRSRTEADRLREINAELLKVAKMAALPGKRMTMAEVQAEFQPDAATLILLARAAIACAEGEDQ